MAVLLQAGPPVSPSARFGQGRLTQHWLKPLFGTTPQTTVMNMIYFALAIIFWLLFHMPVLGFVFFILALTMGRSNTRRR